MLSLRNSTTSSLPRRSPSQSVCWRTFSTTRTPAPTLRSSPQGRRSPISLASRPRRRLRIGSPALRPTQTNSPRPITKVSSAGERRSGSTGSAADAVADALPNQQQRIGRVSRPAGFARPGMSSSQGREVVGVRVDAGVLRLVEDLGIGPAFVAGLGASHTRIALDPAKRKLPRAAAGDADRAGVVPCGRAERAIEIADARVLTGGGDQARRGRSSRSTGRGSRCSSRR